MHNSRPCCSTYWQAGCFGVHTSDLTENRQQRGEDEGQHAEQGNDAVDGRALHGETVTVTEWESWFFHWSWSVRVTVYVPDAEKTYT